MGGACSTHRREENSCGILMECQKEVGRYEGLIILRWILKKGDGMDWIHLAQDRDQWSR
jgi:hypothetical protein